VEGNKIVFEPLDKLAPRAEALFRVNVKAMEPGTVRFAIGADIRAIPREAPRGRWR